MSQPKKVDLTRDPAKIALGNKMKKQIFKDRDIALKPAGKMDINEPNGRNRPNETSE